MFLTGKFTDQESVELVVAALKARGFGPEQLGVFSTEPVDLPGELLDRPSRAWIATLGGGIALGLLAAAVYFGRHDQPLITGGARLLSVWGAAVLFSEMSMLGAFGMTFVMFLWESGLLRCHPPTSIAALQPGCIYVRVQSKTDQPLRATERPDWGWAEVAKECLSDAGARQIEEHPPLLPI